jgi:hypothetical protein
MVWAGVRATITVAFVLAAVMPGAARAAGTPTRYSLANGCWTLRDYSGQPVAGADRLRLQATALGSYLLYRPGGDFLAATQDGSVGPVAQPSPAADWVVTDGATGGFTLSPKSAPGEVLVARAGGSPVLGAAGPASQFTFAPAASCAVYPEAELNATGTPFKGATPFGEVKGWMDGHLHWMNFELLGGNFKCGKPWDPYGIAFALPDCSSVEGPQGSAAPIQNFLDYGSPVSPHDTTGWPTLASWSRQTIGNSHEGSYWRWMQRVWMSGMRLMVMPVNDNRVLCTLYTGHSHPCDEMATVTRALDDMKQLQDYVDAQAGGPGKGFFQIVHDPFEARRVINAGKLAVVEEIEISELFDCQGYDDQVSNCTRADVDRGLKSVYDRGVRSMLLLNKFDNPFTGVRFDSGPIGALINGGNKQSSGSYWSAKTCTGPLHDNTIDYGTGPNASLLDTAVQSLGLGGGTLPAYPAAPDCNTRGLTDLGAYLVRRMIDMGMIVNPDHESQKAVDQTLTIAESRHYSGVISPHGWMDPGNWPRIWKLGGLVRYAGGDVPSYAKTWKQYRPISSPYAIGSPLGTDIAGLFAQPAPSPDATQVMSYPFKSLDGNVTFDKQRTGQRVFDYRTEGIAHYGLYADWLQDLKLHSSPQLISDVMGSAEAYLEMWERAEGVPGPGCLPGDSILSAVGLRAIRLGLGADALLMAAGQPQRRTSAWSWCVRGKGTDVPAVTAVLTPSGTVGLVATTAPGADALGIAPGAPASVLRGHAKPAGGGLWLRRVGGATFVYRVRAGRVRTIAVATNSTAANRTRLTSYLREVRAVVARPAPLVLAATAATRASAANVPPAAAGLTPREASELRLLCSLVHG